MNLFHKIKCRDLQRLRFILSIVMAVVVAWVISETILHAAQGAELRACHRLNIARAVLNQNSYVQYNVLSHTIRYRQESWVYRWIPLTNCHNAVFKNQPAPQPVYFWQHLPPYSALHLTRDN